MIELKTNKTKSDSAKGPDFEISNADNIIRPVFKLLNIDNEVSLGFDNGEGEKSGNELIRGIESGIICDILISFFCVFFCLSIFLEMVNIVILKLPDIYFSINFETIL